MKISIVLISFFIALVICGMCIGDGIGTDNNTTNGSNLTVLENDTIVITESNNTTANNTADDDNYMTFVYIGCLVLFLGIVLICICKKYNKPKHPEEQKFVDKIEPEISVSEKVDNTLHPPTQ